MNFENEIYIYKMSWDAGIAPAVSNGLLSLAICKPAIRNNAKPGDVIVGFAGAGMEMGRLLYFASVDKVLSGDAYYLDPGYANRLDNAYGLGRGGRAIHKGEAFANYDESGLYLKRDIGREKLLAKAKILLSRNFVYLGAEGTKDYLKVSNKLAFIESFGLGHGLLSGKPEARRLLGLYLGDVLSKKGNGYAGIPTLKAEFKAYRAARGFYGKII
jgi:hypothetical protein